MPIAKRRSRRQLPDLDVVGMPEYPAIVLLWSFRLVLESGVLVRFYDRDGILDREDAQSVGIPEEAMNLDRAEMQRFLKQQIKQLERQPEQGMPQALVANTELLAQLVGLNETEQQILMFVALLKTEHILHDLSEMIRIKQHNVLCKMVAKILNLPLTDIKAALSDKSPLLTTGILELEVNNYGNSFNDCFDFFSQKFSELLLAENAEPTAFFQDIIKQAPAPTLKLEHFSHVQPDLDILLPYLQHCVDTDKAGVNILLYGPPGTGKTELSRLLAKQLNINLHEVSCECEEGDAIAGNARMRAYRLAQRCLANTNNLLLFDEVEDVFYQNPFARHAEQRKGWLNRMLEHNPVPTLWLTNNHKVIDPAFIRRFDLVIEMPIPPQAQRADFFHKAAGGILAESTAMQLAAHPMLTPAVIDRASKVVQSIKLDEDKHDKAKILQRVMQQTLSAQGHNLPFGKGQELGEVYDPALINTEANLSQIIEGLKQQGSGRLCLYGPPGTGKTAFAHYLAQQLAKPLIVKRASDLLSPYIGETEIAVAATFAQAAKQQAVLLIDEVDTFLQDRSKARQSWEISMVNELLTQLEQFDGLFIASTNLMQNLDQAALRRFDLKACFSYLKPTQARQLLQAHCQQLGLRVCDSSLQRVVSSSVLTPGDFHAIRRQARFQPFSSAQEFVTALLTDVALKSQAKDEKSKGIGFLQ